MQYAFPSEYGIERKGMTLRDWFAGQALAGILANNPVTYTEWNVSRAYAHADEMLKQRRPE